MYSGNNCGQNLKLGWTVAELLSRQAAQKGRQQGRTERPKIILPSSLVTFFQGWPGLVPNCARRTTTVSSWGFREHGGPTRPPSLLVGERLIFLRPCPSLPLEAVIRSTIPRPGIERIHHRLEFTGQFRHCP